MQLRGQFCEIFTYLLTLFFVLLRLLIPLLKTIPFDNGKEFTQHETMAKALDCETYFARPYRSSERGQNENANGLLHKYFPKTTEQVNVALKQIVEAVEAVDKLNSRLRRCLGFKIPYEVFEELTVVKIGNLRVYALMT